MASGDDGSRVSSVPEAWRVDPLPPALFKVGDGPFRVRGLAYLNALDYADKRLPGGRAALAAALGKDDPWAPYLDQIFIVSADYDISPLARLFLVSAKLEGQPPMSFIQRRSEASARMDVHGMWRPLFKTSSPEAMAERLHMAFNRYFQPCEAKNLSVEPGRFDAELVRVPQPLAGIYVSSTRGFVHAALELARGRDVEVTFEPAVADGKLEGVPLVRARFAVRWTA